MTFIEKIDLLRRARGYSERTLATELGIDPSAISRWRSRDSIPRPEIVKRAADLFGLNPDDLTDKAQALPNQAIFADIKAAASRAKAQFSDNPTAGQIAFEKMIGERATKQERVSLAEYLRERAAVLRREASELERKARVLES